MEPVTDAVLQRIRKVNRQAVWRQCDLSEFANRPVQTHILPYFTVRRLEQNHDGFRS